MPYNDIKDIIPRFNFKGRYQSVAELTSGNVNMTYLMTYMDEGTPRNYTLQKINTFAFREPRAVMNNIALVTEHVKRSIVSQGLSPDRRVLELIHTDDDDIMLEDGRGGFWRAYSFIGDATALDVVKTVQEMEEVGRGFGSFQRFLASFDAAQLHASIPNFHHTTKRFYAFVRALDEDRVGRARQVEPEIEFVFEHRRMMGEIVRLLEDGVIPLRVTHNDTKSNNVLLDSETGKAICVIDLDTVMPGSALYDYGDAIRYGASTASEDEVDTSRISLDMEKARAFTRGFLAETNGYLTQEELMRLPLGVKVITCELAMRFLTDYLDGDRYFKVNSPEHNLVRARAQIALLKDIERKEGQLQEVIVRFIEKLNAGLLS